MNKFCTLLILILLGCSSSSENALSINALFSDNMIIQQNTELSIWGKAPEGSSVHVKSSWGEEASAKTTNEGEWTVILNTPAVDHKPHKLIVSSKKSNNRNSKYTFREVWLASGQSNMEMPLKGFNLLKQEKLLKAQKRK